jgi:hypothetical protein
VVFDDADLAGSEETLGAGVACIGEGRHQSACLFYLLSKGSDGGFVSATRIILHGKAAKLVLLAALQPVLGLGLAFGFCRCGGIHIIAKCENIGICGAGGGAGGGAIGIGGIGCVGGAHCFMCVFCLTYLIARAAKILFWGVLVGRKNILEHENAAKLCFITKNMSFTLIFIVLSSSILLLSTKCSIVYSL